MASNSRGVKPNETSPSTLSRGETGPSTGLAASVGTLDLDALATFAEHFSPSLSTAPKYATARRTTHPGNLRRRARLCQRPPPSFSQVRAACTGPAPPLSPRTSPTDAPRASPPTPSPLRTKQHSSRCPSCLRSLSLPSPASPILQPLIPLCKNLTHTPPCWPDRAAWAGVIRCGHLARERLPWAGLCSSSSRSLCC